MRFEALSEGANIVARQLQHRYCGGTRQPREPLRQRHGHLILAQEKAQTALVVGWPNLRNQVAQFGYQYQILTW